ncbi:DUF2267 domain-containing protein [Rhizomonospora bruguierae]|uniref:DUF2267 domain-containing protein n=1 Tax=Rhizomonospora bruguierae TaxID=1581705 RepID=UPI001BD07852|nr:DUF2267 domain-containing protein [Micromonospora sp. NBRC 107566]
MAELVFIDKVADRAGVSAEVAQTLTEATLVTLARRISGGEAADLADRMPDQLRPFLVKATEPAESFPPQEFVNRVAESSGVDRLTAERGVVGVLRAMRDVVGQHEFEDMLSQLPKEFRALAAGVPMPF